MTTFCSLSKKGGGYKEPKLEELADVLGIEKSDLVLHQSSFDVELTKRCFRKIVEDGLVAPTIAQFHASSEEKSSKHKTGNFGKTDTSGLNPEDELLSDFDFVGKKCIVTGSSSYRNELKKELPNFGARVMKGDVSPTTEVYIYGEGPGKKEKALAEKAKRPDTIHIFTHEAVARKLGLVKE